MFNHANPHFPNSIVYEFHDSEAQRLVVINYTSYVINYGPQKEIYIRWGIPRPQKEIYIRWGTPRPAAQIPFSIS